MWSPQGRLESSQEHADLFLSVLLTVDYQLHAFQKNKNNSNKRNPNLWRVCCRYPFLFRETLNTSAFTVMSGPILGRSSRLMENVVVFCIHDYYLKMYSCHKLFLWLQVNFFFFLCKHGLVITARVWLTGCWKYIWKEILYVQVDRRGYAWFHNEEREVGFRSGFRYLNSGLCVCYGHLTWAVLAVTVLTLNYPVLTNPSSALLCGVILLLTLRSSEYQIFMCPMVQISLLQPCFLVLGSSMTPRAVRVGFGSLAGERN